MFYSFKLKRKISLYTYILSINMLTVLFYIIYVGWVLKLNKRKWMKTRQNLAVAWFFDMILSSISLFIIIFYPNFKSNPFFIIYIYFLLIKCKICTTKKNRILFIFQFKLKIIIAVREKNFPCKKKMHRTFWNLFTQLYMSYYCAYLKTFYALLF